MNNKDLLELAIEVAGHIAGELNVDTDADDTKQIATILVDYFRPWIPDSFEREAINRLFVAARHVAYEGTIDHDSYICAADAGRALRAELKNFDNLMIQRDQEHECDGKEPA